MTEPVGADRGGARISQWREHPYRLLFPCGIVLLWAGIAHWLLLGLGWLTRYESVFHSIAQIQGFLTAFAAGFLLTAIPRRTGTAPPGVGTLLAACLGPVATTATAWFHLWAVSQVCWLVSIATLAAFVLRRFAGPGRRPPASFVLVPASLATGAAGSVLIGLYGAGVTTDFRWHDFGRGLLLQGMFLGLILGVGGLALPLMTRKESTPDADPRQPATLLAHVVGWAFLVATFAIESFGDLRLGYAPRAGFVAVALVLTTGIHRPPSVRGLHRWYMWFAVWLLGIGYAVAAIWPEYRQVGLHTVFLGGFGWLTLAIGMHVPLAHGGAGDRLDRPAPAVVGLGVSVLLSLGARIAAELQPEFRFGWLGWSAGLLLCASWFWCFRVLPFVLPRRHGAAR
jgi:uncharacterized protein involved in response to NO